jgi:hypothetical protein
VDVTESDAIAAVSIHLARTHVSDSALMGWAGDTRAESGNCVALAFLSLETPVPTGGRWIETTQALESLMNPVDQTVLRNALKNDFSEVVAPPRENGMTEAETNVPQSDSHSVQ